MDRLFSLLREYRSEFRRLPRNGKLLVASTLLGSFSVGSFAVGYNLYLVELGVAEDRLGLLVGASSLTAGLVAIPAGVAATRVGLRALILWASAALAVGTALQILPKAYPAILAGNVLGGGGAAIWGVAMAPLLAASADERGRSYLFTLSSIAFLVAVFVGNLVAGFGPSALSAAAGVGLEEGYLGMLGITSIVSGLGLVPLLFLTRGPHVPQGVLSGLRRALEQRAVVFRLLLLHGLVALGAGLVIPFLNVYLVKAVGISERDYGVLAGAGLLMRAGFTAFGPALGTRWGKPVAVALTQLASIPFLLAMALVPLPVAVAAAYLARGALMNMAGPLRGAFYMEAIGADIRPAVNSLLLVTWELCWAAASTAGGALLGAGLSNVQFSLTAALYAASSVGLLFMFGGNGGLARGRASRDES